MPKIRKKTKIFAFFTAFAALVFCLTACGVSRSETSAPQTVSGFYLDTVVSVTYYDAADKNAAEEAMELCAALELVFSRTNPESELYRLNDRGSMAVSDGLLQVLTTALDYSERSGGRFDVTMGAVSALYDFSGSPHVPEQAALTAALSHVGRQHVHIDGNTVSIDDPETVIDLGAAAKGYIAGEMAALLESRGVQHAIVNLGGNITTVGCRPDGTDFKVGIQYPEAGASGLIAAVDVGALKAASGAQRWNVVTSGVYQRFFEENGVTYHHILDSSVGTPARTGLASVTVIGPEGTDCDALSTLCFLLGPEEGMTLIDGMEDYWALFVTEDMELLCSEGLDALLVSD